MRFWTEKRILLGMVLLYVLVFGTVTALRHYNFQTQTWDLAAFVQTFWNTTQGRIMFNNIEQASNHLGVHWTPWLFVLIPGYFLFATPYYLLFIQTLALAAGAFPLYFLALRVLQKKNLALLITAGYLLYPSLHWVNTFDFHEISFLVPLLLAAFYFLDAERWWLGGLFLTLSASVREDAIPAVLFIGIFFLARKKWKIGIITSVLALIYLILVLKIFIPSLAGGELFRFDRYYNLGATPGEAIKNVLTDPALVAKTVFTLPKIKYLLVLFAPVAFLPFFSGSAFLLLIPGLAENLLTYFPLQFSGTYQYDSLLIPGIFIATIYGLKKIIEKWPSKEKLVKWILITAMAIGFFARSPVSPITFPFQLFKSNPTWETYRKLVQIVPDNASVAAPTNLIPHLSNREHSYMLGKEKIIPDVVIIDGADSFGFDTFENFQKYADNYINSGIYNVTIIDDRYAIMIKKGLK
ncbi:MAG: DUF2079 domain-containing protein [Patescibacteria group bacterium]